MVGGVLQDYIHTLIGKALFVKTQIDAGLKRLLSPAFSFLSLHKPLTMPQQTDELPSDIGGLPTYQLQLAEQVPTLPDKNKSHIGDIAN